jgi:hypothetical protein
MPCLDCGRPGVRRRCDRCARGRDRARGSRQARGYDAEHDRLRAKWQRRMDDGELVVCATCPTVLTGRAWDLGHDPADRSRYRGPQCLPCNRGHRDG